MSSSEVIINEKSATDLLTHDFYYDLPQERIAQTPAEPRDSSRLMVVDRIGGGIEHRTFRDIIEYLRPEDMLVVNSSKVICARLLGESERGFPIELLLLRQRGDRIWETLTRPGKRAKVGAKFSFGGVIEATVIEVKEDGNRLVRIDYPDRFSNIYEALDRVGNMPLPPYITQKLKDKNRYQTVYAKEEGSAAAPTAGLHFTDELLSRIREMGVGYGEVTLHVGLGTFRPVKAERVDEHIMHTEHFHIDEATAAEINRRRAAGGRIIAVGTTSCRVLESASDESGLVHPFEGETGIFIYPGYKFKAVDALITNFHLPESSLLMLVSAFYNRGAVMDIYKKAVEMEYRFFSFGDSMFIQ